MKTIQRSLLVTLCLIVCAQISLWAVPAKPGAFTYTQPDGTVISLERHGDEFFSWTTLAGTSQVVVMDADGFYRASSLNKAGIQEGLRLRRSANQMRPRGIQNDNVMTHGERHIPVLLVHFTDNKFSVSDPKTKFTNLLNQKDYSDNGGTGSVQDFYYDNSHGEFKPVFDVYGPVELPYNMAHYGAHKGNRNDTCPQDAVFEAAKKLNSEIDFSQYDYNKDGLVDMILMYYAGYNEAEGGSANTIWPHQSDVRGNQEASTTKLDGKYLSTYFCTSELRGNEGVNMCGIGTTCHEFGHSLGLPDFYDTDYAENGLAGGLYAFSTMCSGSYNNQGRTPPYFNAEERIMLGWMSHTEVPELESGALSFGSIKDDIAYRSSTDTEGEYFLYEYRDGSGWDKPIPKGMLIYHVDKSTVRSVGGITPYEQWVNWTQYNTINAYGDHPCFYVVPAPDPRNLYYEGDGRSIQFPGAQNVTSFSPVDWEDQDTGVTITGISLASDKISFNVSVSVEQRVVGKVVGQDDQPIAGVYVTLSKPAAPNRRLQKAPLAASHTYEAVTDSQGDFVISLEGFEGETAHLSFSKNGYEPSGMDVSLSPRATRVQAVIKKVGEGDLMEYSYHDPSESADVLVGGDGVSNSLMAAIRIPAGDLPSNGGRLTKVSFPALWTAKDYYVVVDSGKERLLFSKIPGLGSSVQQGRTVDVNLASMNVSFSSDKDLYVGIAVEDANPYSSEYTGWLFFVTQNTSNCYISDFNASSSNWNSRSYALVLTASVIPAGSGEEPDPKEWTLADMGFNAIADPGFGTYAAGHSFALDVVLANGAELQSQINWTLDGKAIAQGAKSVTLTAGKHTITASYTLTDGTSETQELVVNVQ